MKNAQSRLPISRERLIRISPPMTSSRKFAKPWTYMAEEPSFGNAEAENLFGQVTVRGEHAALECVLAGSEGRKIDEELSRFLARADGNRCVHITRADEKYPGEAHLDAAVEGEQHLGWDTCLPGCSFSEEPVTMACAATSTEVRQSNPAKQRASSCCVRAHIREAMVRTTVSLPWL